MTADPTPERHGIDDGRPGPAAVAILVVVAALAGLAGTATVAGEHGASVHVTIDETTSPVAPGEPVTVTATVENGADAALTNAVSLEIDGETVDSVTPRVGSGGAETVELTWETGDADPGSYTARVVTEGAADTATVRIEADQGPTMDVEILETTAPVVEGESLTVSATITNLGGESGSTDVQLLVGNETVGGLIGHLEPEASETVDLSWETGEGDAGEHTVLVMTEDDADETTVVVEAPDDRLAVDIAGPAGPVEADAPVQLEATVSGASGAVTDYAWDLGDGTTDAGENRSQLSHTYAEAGEYEATVTVTDASGATATAAATVVAEAPERPAFSVSIAEVPDAVAAGDPLEVVATVENPGEETATEGISLAVGGEVRDHTNVTLAAGDTETVTLTWAEGADTAEDLTVSVSGTADSDTASVDVTEEGLGLLVPVGIGVVGLALVSAGGVYYVRRRTGRPTGAGGGGGRPHRRRRRGPHRTARPTGARGGGGQGAAMNKAELIDSIASEADVAVDDAEGAVDAFIDTTTKALKKGNRVSLVGLGSFGVSQRAAQAGAKKVVKFKPGAELSGSVDGGGAGDWEAAIGEVDEAISAIQSALSGTEADVCRAVIESADKRKTTAARAADAIGDDGVDVGTVEDALAEIERRVDEDIGRLEEALEAGGLEGSDREAAERALEGERTLRGDVRDLTSDGPGAVSPGDAGRIEADAIASEAELPTGEAERSLEGLAEVTADGLRDGRPVELGGLGTLRPASGLAEGLEGKKHDKHGAAEASGPEGKKHDKRGVADADGPEGKKHDKHGAADATGPEGKKHDKRGAADATGPEGKKHDKRGVARSGVVLEPGPDLAEFEAALE